MSLSNIKFFILKSYQPVAYRSKARNSLKDGSLYLKDGSRIVKIQQFLFVLKTLNQCRGSLIGGCIYLQVLAPFIPAENYNPHVGALCNLLLGGSDTQWGAI